MQHKPPSMAPDKGQTGHIQLLGLVSLDLLHRTPPTIGYSPLLGVHLISVQKVTVRVSPQSEDWRGVCSRGERKCLSRFEFLLVS